MTYFVFVPVIAAVIVAVVVIARQHRSSDDVAIRLLFTMCFGVVAITATRLVAHTVFPDDDTALIAASYVAALLVFFLTAHVASYFIRPAPRAPDEDNSNGEISKPPTPDIEFPAVPATIFVAAYRRLHLLGTSINGQQSTARFRLAGAVPANVLANMLDFSLVTFEDYARLSATTHGGYPMLRKQSCARLGWAP